VNDVLDESPEAELRRMVYSGTIWFGAVLLAVAVGMAGVVVSGWRPSELPPGAGAVWWIGAVAWVVSLGNLAWAGCPTLGFPLRSAVKQKQICSRIGVMAAVVAAALTAAPVLIA
jgi:hypothetical protein